MQTDILIIGGGLSGLALADHLQAAGTDYLLVEARGRLGGRIESQEVGGAQFDLGPAWFWPGQPLMAALVERLNLTLFEQYSTGDIISQDSNGAVHRGTGYASMEGSYRLAGGFTALITGLSQALDTRKIQLDSRVVSLTWEKDEVTAKVTTKTGEKLIHAKHVVLALPPRIAASSITFTPPLPKPAMDALSSVPTWMAGHAKILAVYDQPHWRDAGLSGDAMSQKGPMVEIHDACPVNGGPYALVGFVGFPAEVRNAHRSEMIAMAKEQLVALFGPNMTKPQAFILHDWAQQALTATKTDHTPPDHHPTYAYPHAAKDLWDGRILLGSTEVASQFGGFLEGALVAARDAARTVTGPLAPVE